MKIALPQLNYEIGHIAKNRDRIIEAIRKAKAQKADLVIFPEQAICGLYPRDLLEREYFVNECRMAIEKIAETCQGIAALVGAPNFDLEDGILFNALFFMHDGEVRGGANKTIISDYDVFDESRYFVGGDESTPIRYKEQVIRIIFDEYESENIEKGDTLILHAGVTPFTAESCTYRKEVFSSIAAKQGIPLISLNTIGANTSLIFDGNTLVFNAKGTLTHQMAAFKEDFLIIDTTLLPKAPPIVREEEKMATIYRALVLGIRDYFQKHGFTKAVLGLSGGVDSALVAVLAADALGAEQVWGILMPSPYSTEHSVCDAVALAQNLGITHDTLPIRAPYEASTDTLSPLFKGLPFSVAEENLQARIRGMLLMALSNKFGHILLNTSNKSEVAVGYGTLYGDMCGSLAVLGDLYKTEVYALCRYINRQQEIIPEHILTKAPSAELHPGQTDQDSLPDYPTLDAVLKLYLEENTAPTTIVRKGFDAAVVEKIIRLINNNEYKRAQAPPVLRISKKAFGEGRRMPF